MHRDIAMTDENATPAHHERADRLIEKAFEFGFPVFEMARLADRVAKAGALNQLRHRRRLLDHTSRSVTAPNNDTLYSNAWLDLSNGSYFDILLSCPS